MFSLKIEKQDDGTWAAYDDNRYDGDIESLSIGRGDTEDEALEDLAEAMEFNDEGSKLIRDVLDLMRQAGGGSLTVVTRESAPAWRCTRCGREPHEIGHCNRGPCPMGLQVQPRSIGSAAPGASP